MKINKRNYKHWIYLATFTLNVLIALALRPFKRKKALAILYGHKLNGNLKAIYDYHKLVKNPCIEIVYLTMDPQYHQELRMQGINSVCGLSLASTQVISYARCIVSDHGLHALELALYLSDLKFADVWHGIPFKGFDSSDFQKLHKYDEIWVTSESVKEKYINQFGFCREKIFTTGYARTDKIIDASDRATSFKYLPSLNRKTLLYAPTWKQDNKNRSIFPFNTSEIDFLAHLEDIGKRTDTNVIIRTHLNSSEYINTKRFKHISFVSTAEEPDTEKLLCHTDVLICDWSSLAFDYALLYRPTIFLNTPPPFKKGFSFGPNYRFGRVVNDIADLYSAALLYINSPEYYDSDFLPKQRGIVYELYGENADGQSSKRCFSRLMSLTLENN